MPSSDVKTSARMIMARWEIDGALRQTGGPAGVEDHEAVFRLGDDGAARPSCRAISRSY